MSAQVVWYDSSGKNQNTEYIKMLFLLISVELVRRKKFSSLKKKMVVDRTLYDVLGVEPNATQETIAKVKTRQEYFLIKDLEEIFDLKLNKYILIVNID